MKTKLSIWWLLAVVVVPFVVLLVLDYRGVVCLGRGAGFCYLGYFVLVLTLWVKARVRGLMAGAVIGSLLLSYSRNGMTENTYWLALEEPSLPAEEEGESLFVRVSE